MRLIDAENASNGKFPTVPEGISEVYVKGWNDAIDAVVENAPTIEYSKNSLDYDYGFAEGLRRAREKKGSWIDLGYALEEYRAWGKCSVCGGGMFQSDFCPNCGADMREGADNDKVD